MMIAIYLILVLLNEVVSNGSSDNEHVHFKIHVPEIIKHRFHTKTIYVHVHKPVSRKKEKPRKKKMPKINHEEDHREKWNSWSSYDYKENHEDKHMNIYDHSKDHNADNDHKDPKDTQKHFSPYFNNDNLQNVKDSYLPEPNIYDGNYEHSNQKEKGKDTETNDVPISYHYEEGYRRGLQSETGHKYADKLNKFLDDKYEESEASKDNYEHQSEEKYKDEGRTHAGRYLVDESELEDDDSKYEETNHAARKRNVSKKHLLSKVPGNDKEV